MRGWLGLCTQKKALMLLSTSEKAHVLNRDFYMYFMQLLDSYYIMWVAFCLSQITMDDNDGGCHCTYRLYLLYNMLSAITTDHSYSFSVIAPEVADPVTLYKHTDTHTHI